MMPRSFKVRYIPCPFKSCGRQFTNQGGLKNHIRIHRTPQPIPVHHPSDLTFDEQDIPVDIRQDAQEMEHQGQPMPEKPAREKIAYYPLINGL
jgi:hypothetical protein